MIFVDRRLSKKMVPLLARAPCNGWLVPTLGVSIRLTLVARASSLPARVCVCPPPAALLNPVSFFSSPISYILKSKGRRLISVFAKARTEFTRRRKRTAFVRGR